MLLMQKRVSEESQPRMLVSSRSLLTILMQTFIPPMGLFSAYALAMIAIQSSVAQSSQKTRK